MRNARSVALGLALTIVACACPAPGPPGALRLVAEPRAVTKQHCVAPQQCADFTINYFDIHGADSNITRTVRDIVQRRALALLGGDEHRPFAAALDSVATQFIDDFVYEVAPHAVGPTNIVLTWEQLGDLAERSRWVP